MQTTKKKPNILLIVLGAVLASYLGYLVAGAWREGIEFNGTVRDGMCLSLKGLFQ